MVSRNIDTFFKKSFYQICVVPMNYGKLVHTNGTYKNVKIYILGYEVS
jgi:hypothetical protein